MPLYDGPIQSNDSFYRDGLDRIQQPIGDALEATARDAWMHNPLQEGMDFIRPYLGAGVMRDYATGNVADPDAFNKQYGDIGLHIDSPISRNVADLMVSRKQEELRLNSILSRAPDLLGFKAAAFGTSLAVSAIDPLNVAASFVPVVGESRAALWAARFGKTAARVGEGAVEGAAGAALLEPIRYANEKAYEGNYGAYDSFLNVTMGGILGGGLHAGFGAVSDLLGRAHPETREGALRSSVAQMAEGRPVDVSPVLASDPSLATAPEPVPTRQPFGDFPDVVVQRPWNDAARVKESPDYAAAKAGDGEAAGRYVDAALSDDKVNEVRAMAGNEKPTLIAVHAIEASGRNAIPQAYAATLAQRLGLPLEDNVVQANRPMRTGSSPLHRIAQRVAFDGQIEPGKSYILVDDHVHQGGTLADLKGHIEGQGGKVLGATTLTAAKDAHILAAPPTAIDALRAKFPGLEQEWRQKYGFDFDSLTQSEAQYLSRHNSAESVRNSVLARGQAEGRSQPAGGTASAREEPGAAIARAREDTLAASRGQIPSTAVSPQAAEAATQAVKTGAGDDLEEELQHALDTAAEYEKQGVLSAEDAAAMQSARDGIKQADQFGEAAKAAGRCLLLHP